MGNLFAIIIIIASGLAYTTGLESVVDIGLYDETYYLHIGLQTLTEGLPHPTNGPLYAVWYLILSLIQPDRIALYYMNYKLSLILTPAIIYGLLRANSVPRSICLALSLFTLVSTANSATWPRISHFALLLILVTLLLVGQSQKLTPHSGSIAA
ncbi:hypothetical protein, partial [Chloroflexus sp.]